MPSSLPLIINNDLSRCSFGVPQRKPRAVESPHFLQQDFSLSEVSLQEAAFYSGPDFRVSPRRPGAELKGDLLISSPKIWVEGRAGGWGFIRTACWWASKGIQGEHSTWPSGLGTRPGPRLSCFRYLAVSLRRHIRLSGESHRTVVQRNWQITQNLYLWLYIDSHISCVH